MYYLTKNLFDQVFMVGSEHNDKYIKFQSICINCKANKCVSVETVHNIIRPQYPYPVLLHLKEGTGKSVQIVDEHLQVHCN